ncbi:MAG: hypothetical protein HN790_12415 [Methylococcales bacterium]|nr:hypothetical protein [Methylococcales bacterium]
MLRFLNVIVLLFVMLSNGHAQSALESSFIDLFTFGSVLDFKGKLQTVTETTEWVGQKKRVKQVCAFDVSGRLVRIFYYENGVYQYLTKIRYHKTTGLPEWLVTNDHKTKSAQRYHLEFNQDLTKAFQYHIDAKQKATLVKSATRQDSQVFVRKDTEQGELVQQFALSPSGRVLSNMQNLGDQVVSRQRTQYNRQGLAQKVTISIGHEVQTAELVHKLDERAISSGSSGIATQPKFRK